MGSRFRYFREESFAAGPRREMAARFTTACCISNSATSNWVVSVTHVLMYGAEFGEDLAQRLRI
jgi:hypothetical protein